MTTDPHPCPGGCGRRVPYELVACSTCWPLLPIELRLAVSEGGPRRLANISAALRWYREYRYVEMEADRG